MPRRSKLRTPARERRAEEYLRRKSIKTIARITGLSVARVAECERALREADIDAIVNTTADMIRITSIMTKGGERPADAGDGRITP